jgi:hypothetical protein
VTEPEILPSARKHGISDERMRHVLRTCPMPLDHPAGNGQVIYLGPDQRGVPLEVVAFQGRRRTDRDHSRDATTPELQDHV